MPSETFYCPRCHRQLTKSAQAYVLGEIMGSKKSGFIGLGELAETVTCPGCGTAIDTRKMIAGDYDRPGGRGGCLGPIAGLATFAGAVFYFDLPWWGGLICGFIAGLLAEIVSSKLRAKRAA